ncbi:FMN-binding protein [Arthrobacter burdickii]|uniref:FMN-binding protein n=1 Tax=Arthrobacter burdickii TaxID=3035920 RepID=A0ABT8JY74_9MICC|nr:FMN-binding protein [Arthrobacter burdickii]MDN4610119.1 FMN-binding protein [Arthrobacter burdickii]
MRARAILGSAAASLSILVLGWQLGGQPATVAGSTTSPPTGTGTDDGSPASSALDTGAAASYTGTTSTSRYGSITVSITVEDGTLTDATAEVSADDGRSRSISARAVPLLRSEVLTAQSADVSMVSGATYTSEGYLSSLQSALDQAGL